MVDPIWACSMNSLAILRIVAAGDGANDLDMIKAAGKVSTREVKVS